jgi:hypothetical protein
MMAYHSPMQKVKRALLAGVAVLTVAGTSAKAAPAIIGGSQDARCREALHMAEVAFRSTSASLVWPIAQPSNPNFKIILKQNGADISGGWAIDADPDAFEIQRAIGQKELPRPIYWRRTASASKRLAIVDSHGGWRGDTYSLFVLSSDASFDRVALQLIPAEGDRETALKPLLEDRWNIPIVLTEKGSGADWLIDRGEPYEIMADWQVHAVTAQELATTCRIAFGYDERAGLGGLPSAVRRFAAALNQALGPGTDEGTSQPTAGIRLAVERGWANAALRPWALTDAPYNSRVEVERGLDLWARGNPRRTALRRRIGEDYWQAERALASYYEARHGMESVAARNLSRQVTDAMFRSYFMFPKSD